MTDESKEKIYDSISSINDDMTEEEIMQIIYSIPKSSPDEKVTPELKVKQKEVFKSLYNLIISSDKGPALSTLVKAVGMDKVKELIAPLKTRNIETEEIYLSE